MHDRNEGLEVVSRADGLENIQVLQCYEITCAILPRRASSKRKTRQKTSGQKW